MKQCPKCHGKGIAKSGNKCPACHGAKKVSDKRCEELQSILKDVYSRNKTHKNSWVII